MPAGFDVALFCTTSNYLNLVFIDIFCTANDARWRRLHSPRLISYHPLIFPMASTGQRQRTGKVNVET
jgi:hypothetical protein